MTNQPARRVRSALAAETWAITEDALTAMVAISDRINDPVEVVERRLGRPLANARTVTLRDGVATIPIRGPIFRRANLFTEVSGGTSIDILAQDIEQARTSPSVTAILLDIESPGGSISGINELAEMIYALRSTIPVHAYVGSLCASGAYWIASAADRIIMDATAQVGSIGVVTTVTQDTPNDRTITFVSSRAPYKRLDPGSDEGRTDIQRRIDTLGDIFIEAVARYRNVDAATVESQFGQGGMLIGTAAVAAGMADSIGSYESTLRALRENTERSPRMSPRMSDTSVSTPPVMPDMAAELAALREQVQAERSRRIESEAQAFAQAVGAERRITPGEQGPLAQLYVQLAQDDANAPAATSRIALLTTLVNARTPHTITSEVAGGLSLLAPAASPTTTQADELAKIAEETRSYAARANGRGNK